MGKTKVQTTNNSVHIFMLDVLWRELKSWFVSQQLCSGPSSIIAFILLRQIVAKITVVSRTHTDYCLKLLHTFLTYVGIVYQEGVLDIACL